jgi:hypothetical protein
VANDLKASGEEEILEMRDQVAVLGSNDFEFGAIENILRELHEHKITLDAAIALARLVLNSKQDYH